MQSGGGDVAGHCDCSNPLNVSLLFYIILLVAFFLGQLEWQLYICIFITEKHSTCCALLVTTNAPPSATSSGGCSTID